MVVMTKAIIFDLDMCILDTRTISVSVLHPVLNVLHGSAISSFLKTEIERQLWTTSLEDIINQFALPTSLAEELRDSYLQIEIPNDIKTFGDNDAIAQLPVAKLLVTSGYRRLQESKIDKLGIKTLFDEIVIDAIDNPESRMGKEKIFREILQRHGWNQKEVLVVGDSASSELAAAKSLQIPTAQILRPTIQRADDVDHHIHSFYELAELIST